MAEVKIAKRILSTPNLHRSLTLHRATPNHIGRSPAQLMFGYNIRTRVPRLEKRDMDPVDAEVRNRDARYKRAMAE